MSLISDLRSMVPTLQSALRIFQVLHAEIFDSEDLRQNTGIFIFNKLLR